MKYIKQKWQKFHRWFRRVFFNEYTTIKPTGTVSRLTGAGSGVEPLFGTYYNRDGTEGAEILRRYTRPDND